MKKLIMAVAVAATTALGALADHVHCVCGTGACAVGGHAHSDVEWTAWTATDSLPPTAGHWYLASDVTLTEAWEPVDGTYLCLNGHVVRQTAADHVIRLGDGVSFTLTDCDASVVRKWTKTPVDSEENRWYWILNDEAAGTEGVDYWTTKGGVLTGGAPEGGLDGHGAGVDVGNSSEAASFTLYGGTIAGNLTVCGDSEVNCGGGVRVAGKSRFLMYGGRICGNYGYRGGGVSSCGRGVFDLKGGLIDDNSANYGGGLYVTIRPLAVEEADTAVTNAGARVEGNEANKGAGLYSEVATRMVMTGGVFAGNRAFNCCGGLYVVGSLELFGGSVTNNPCNVDDLVEYTGAVCFGEDKTAPHEFIVGGRPVVTGNLNQGLERNVAINTNVVKVTVSEAIPPAVGARIGVTLRGEYERTPGSGVFSNPSETNAVFAFVSDDSMYWVKYNAAKELELVIDDSHQHCICGTGACAVGGHAHSNVVWKAWSRADGLPTMPGNWYLTQDVTLESEQRPEAGVCLCLNGHVVRQTAETGSIISANGYEDCEALVITDCNQKKTRYFTDPNGEGCYDAMSDEPSEGALKVVGGVLTGARGVAIGSRWLPVEIYAGTIVGNNDGGVSMYSAELRMYGGRICGNRADEGGGVRCGNNETPSTSILCGGSIDRNTASSGGGWHVASPGTALRMTGGEISSNRATDGGGIYNCDAGDLLLLGGVVTNNVAEDAAGGVRCNRESYMGECQQIVGGTLVVADNSPDNVEVDNSYDYAQNMVLQVSEETPLEEGAMIGVTLLDGAGRFTLPTETNASTNFFSDSSDYVVAYNEETQEHELRGISRVGFYAMHGDTDPAFVLTNDVGGTFTFPEPPASMMRTGYDFSGWLMRFYVWDDETRYDVGDTSPTLEETSYDAYADWTLRITQQPHATNDYTVAVAATDALEYQWYRWNAEWDDWDEVPCLATNRLIAGRNGETYKCTITYDDGDKTVDTESVVWEEPDTLVEVRPVAGANATVEGVYTNEVAVVPVGGKYYVFYGEEVGVDFAANAGYLFPTTLDRENPTFAATEDPIVVQSASAYQPHTCHDMKLVVPIGDLETFYLVCSNSYSGYLTADLTVDHDIDLGLVQLTHPQICLNGHVLDLNGHAFLQTGISSYFYDCQHDVARHYEADEDGLWHLVETPSATSHRLDGGVIIGGSAGENPGVFDNGVVSLTFLDVNVVGNDGGEGAVVYSSCKTRFIGGALCGNRADLGVLYEAQEYDCWCRVGGGVCITNNVSTEGVPCNLLVREGGTISLDPDVQLTPDASIGVTAEYGPITEELPKDYSPCFTPDHDGDVITNRANNQLFLLGPAATVTFDANGGEKAPAAITTLRVGDILSMPGPGAMTRAGYAFEGWMLDGELKSVGDTVKIAGETMTLTADWTLLITRQPTYANAYVVGIEATDVLSYAWYDDWGEIVEGQTGPQLTDGTEGEKYFCRLTYEGGEKTVDTNRAIWYETHDPVTVTVGEGTHATLDGVYTNGVKLVKEGDRYVVTYSEVVVAVFEAEAGYGFPDGTTVFTNAVTALDDPTAIAGAKAYLPHVHCLCGDGACAVPGHAHQDLTWQPWTATNALPTASGNWYLTEDVTLTKQATLDAVNIRLCLNGHTVRQGADPDEQQTIVRLDADNCRFALTDCADAATPGLLTEGANGAVIVGAGVFDLWRGSLAGNTSENDGGAVLVDRGNEARFRMYGGTICGNHSSDGSGGGVYVDAETHAEFYGGAITNNVAGSLGGGVFCLTWLGSYASDVVIGGALVVTDNQAGEKTDNLHCLRGEIVFSADVPLTAAARVGISYTGDDTMSVATQVFAKAYGTDCTAHLFSDDPFAYVAYNGEQQHELRTRVLAQPTAANGYTFELYTNGLAAGSVTYQWNTNAVAEAYLTEEDLTYNWGGTWDGEVCASSYDDDNERHSVDFVTEQEEVVLEFETEIPADLKFGSYVDVQETGADYIRVTFSDPEWREFYCWSSESAFSFKVKGLVTVAAPLASETAAGLVSREEGLTTFCRATIDGQTRDSDEVTVAGFVPAASVTGNGVTKYFSTLEEAWTNAVSKEYNMTNVVVRMLKDATVSETLRRTVVGFIGYVLTLDLNDHVLAYAGESDACVVEQAAGQAMEIVDTATTRTRRYFTCDKGTGLWTLTDAQTDRFVNGGVITGGRAGAVSVTYGNKTNVFCNVNIVGNLNDSGDGGAVAVSYGTLVISDSTFLGNVSAGNGGAIASGVPCLMTDCRVEANVAGGLGGGVYMKRCGSLVRTEVVGNRAGTGGGVYLTFQTSSCFPAGTQILMADGTEKTIESVAEGDVVRTFDHVGGTNSSAAVFYVYRGEGARDVFALSFASGTTLDIVDRHDLLLETTRKYLTLSSDNARSYLGKRFYNAVRGEWDELVDVQSAQDGGAYYSIYTRGHGNCVANGMLTVPDDKDCFINIYELDENLKADAERLAADIATYGLAKPADYPNVPLDDFVDGNNRYAFVAIGKGLTTQEEILFWNEFDYGPIMAKKTASARKLMMAAATPKLTTATLISKPTEPYLEVGEGAVVTGNVSVAGTDNVYLKPSVSFYGTEYNPVIDILSDATGIDIGVTLSTGGGVFGWTNAVNYVTSFFSDNPTYSVSYTADGVLALRAGIQVGGDAWATVGADGTCTIIGTGAMWNHGEWTAGNPLAAQRMAIRSVVVEDGVTSVGSQFFHKFYAITNVSCAASVTAVGDHAFYRCASLQAMSFAGADAPAFGTNAYTMHAGISIKDGMPDVYAIPAITISGYTQNLYGRENLTEGDWEKITTEAQKRTCRFFKIVLEK